MTSAEPLAGCGHPLAWTGLYKKDYASAMRQVYSEIAKVSDVLVVVTKNPTRNGQLRRLDLDTIALLEATSWTIKCVHRAILFIEVEQYEMMRWTHDTLPPEPSPEVAAFLEMLEEDEEAEAERQGRQDVLAYFAEYEQWEATGYWGPGGIVKRVVGRLSFFKRLSYQKGSPVADHEDILIATRDGGQGGLRTVMSPPYMGNTVHETTGLNVERFADPQRVGRSSQITKGGYGQTPGNIGNLK